MWEHIGIDTKEMVRRQLDVPDVAKVYQRGLFSKIVPNYRKLGLLDAGNGWLRDRFTDYDLNAIDFELTSAKRATDAAEILHAHEGS